VPVLSTTIPAFPVRDIGTAVEFYGKKLGFRCFHQEKEFAIIGRDQAIIHLWLAGDHGWGGRDDLASKPVKSGAESFLAGTASCRVQVDGVDELFADLKPRGVVHPNSGLKDQYWGDRDFSVLDGDGNRITFFERRARQSG
jgi:catechol 2,3-dioxygenase-like lactoylglutathione lyase family enzyme